MHVDFPFNCTLRQILVMYLSRLVECSALRNGGGLAGDLRPDVIDFGLALFEASLDFSLCG
jgi:hypothetical protein